MTPSSKGGSDDQAAATGAPGARRPPAQPRVGAGGRTGRPVVIPGNVFLQVTAQPAAAHDDAGNPTYTGPRQFTTPSLANVRAVALTGDFEGVLSVGLGMDH